MQKKIISIWTCVALVRDASLCDSGNSKKYLSIISCKPFGDSSNLRHENNSKYPFYNILVRFQVLVSSNMLIFLHLIHISNFLVFCNAFETSRSKTLEKIFVSTCGWPLRWCCCSFFEIQRAVLSQCVIALHNFGGHTERRGSPLALCAQQLCFGSWLNYAGRAERSGR